MLAHVPNIYTIFVTEISDVKLTDTWLHSQEVSNNSKISKFEICRTIKNKAILFLFFFFFFDCKKTTNFIGQIFYGVNPRIILIP